MNVRTLAVAMFCAAGPFALTSCAQPIDVSETSSPDNGSTGGSTASTGGSTSNGTGGSAGGIGMIGSTGGTGSSTATGGSPATATGGTGTGGKPATGGAGAPAATGGTTAAGGHAGGTSGTATGGHAGGTSGTATGGRNGGSSATGGRNAGTGGTTATGGVSGTGGKATGGSTGAAGSTGTGGTTGSSSSAAGTIVPLYTDPTDSSWNAIVTAALAHPTVEVVAIVNPADGPGSSKRSDYTTGIATLQAAKIKVIGYIATGYASHSISSMEAEIDSWKSFYPTLQGIFFDEQSNDPADVAHYQTLSQYAKSQGLSYTVGNPGTDVPTSYIGALDTMLVYESDGVPSISSLQKWGAYAPANFGVIPYKVSSMNASFVSQARQYVRYVYLTADDLPNPWDSLTPYFSDLLGALE